MTTDYQKLSVFEVAAVLMAFVGVALISFQIFIALPGETQIKVSSSMKIFDMADAAAEVYSIQKTVVIFGMDGMKAFNQEFYYASGEVLAPVAEGFNRTIANVQVIGRTFAMIADNAAIAHQNNIVSPVAESGVEDEFAGKVMGAYYEQLESLAQ